VNALNLSALMSFVMLTFGPAVIELSNFQLVFATVQG